MTRPELSLDLLQECLRWKGSAVQSDDVRKQPFVSKSDVKKHEFATCSFKKNNEKIYIQFKVVLFLMLSNSKISVSDLTDLDKDFRSSHQNRPWNIHHGNVNKVSIMLLCSRITFVSGSGPATFCPALCFKSSIASSNMFFSSCSFSTSSRRAVPLTSSSFQTTKGRRAECARVGRSREGRGKGWR